jgi:hypothetical protein
MKNTTVCHVFFQINNAMLAASEMFNLVKSCQMFRRFGYCYKYNIYRSTKHLESFIPGQRDRSVINPFINGTYHVDRSDSIYRNFNLYGNNRSYALLETNCCGNGCQYCVLMNTSG